MNERIKELAVQADLLIKKSNGDEFRYGNFDPRFQKFAELIVKECAGIVADAVDHREPASTYVNKIKQHFGVEERKGWVCPKCGVDRTQDVCPKGHTAAVTGDCPMTATAQTQVEG